MAPRDKPEGDEVQGCTRQATTGRVASVVAVAFRQ